MTVQITMKQLLETGAHFGHQTSRWNPKMKPYIFGERNGIHIINLQKTVGLLKDCLEFIEQKVRSGADVMFVGTKKQAQSIIAEEAKRCGMYYVNYRWLGGTITNFDTIKNTIEKLKRIETMKEDGTYDSLPKKETVRLERIRVKLENNLGGIKEMEEVPQFMVVFDPQKEHIAAKEAKKKGLILVGIADTNCSPDDLDFVIPGNDDSIKSISYFANTIAEACIQGRQGRKQKDLQKAKEEGTDIQYDSSGSVTVEKLQEDVASVRTEEGGISE